MIGNAAAVSSGRLTEAREQVPIGEYWKWLLVVCCSADQMIESQHAAHPDGLGSRVRSFEVPMTTGFPF